MTGEVPRHVDPVSPNSGNILAEFEDVKGDDVEDGWQRHVDDDDDERERDNFDIEEGNNVATCSDDGVEISDEAEKQIVDGEVPPPPVPGQDDEMRRPRVKRRPVTPTKQDIEDHFPLHLEYRSWCAHCVAGKAISDRHIVDKEQSDSMGVTWHSDYAFMGSEAEPGMQPCLICYDDDKDAFWALAVKEKGPSRVVVRWEVGKINDCGYSGEAITMKNDNEASLVAVTKSVAAMRAGETVMINSPVRASKSNGKMERAVRKWQGQLRTTKHRL